jgi:hypothetical protein
MNGLHTDEATNLYKEIWSTFNTFKSAWKQVTEQVPVQDGKFTILLA